MRRIPESELIINADGSAFHLHLKPEQLADRIILVGDPARVSFIGEYLDSKECDLSNREFHSITGNHKGKRISIISHGIGCDNMDIVISELDALANIDFRSRTVKTDFRQLTMVRIGTSGGLQPFVPVGTCVAAEKSIGLDGVLYFYAGNEKIRDLAFENELLQQLEWKISGLRPYVVSSDTSLLAQIVCDDILCGTTIAANGFYGPQGRELRLSLSDSLLNQKIISFEYNNRKITNYEMESSALAGLSALMGHKAMTVCCVIAGRVDKRMNTEYQSSLPELIEKVLMRI
ncbi:MAG: nucleoside phosphorylase [Tannerella sp.]|jgi:uridine phosphorylase|nr:nucleoside phosphorylase [Tannerella sp.]